MIIQALQLSLLPTMDILLAKHGDAKMSKIPFPSLKFSQGNGDTDCQIRRNHIAVLDVGTKV